MTENTSPVLVIGGTGKIGRLVSTELQKRGHQVRIFARGLAGPASGQTGMEVYLGELRDTAKLAKALRGVENVFLLWPFLSSSGSAETIDAISGHARRLVYLSTLGAGDDVESTANPINQVHYGMEQLIERSGLEWTFLRPSGFASNVLLWADQIQNGDVVQWPFSEASRSLIHDGDLAEVAVKALVENGHVRAKYVLTGPESLTQREMIRRISVVLGRTLRFEEVEPDIVRQQLLAWDMPRPFVDGVLHYLAERVARPEVVTDTIRNLTGKAARPIQEWIEDNIDSFSAN